MYHGDLLVWQTTGEVVSEIDEIDLIHGLQLGDEAAMSRFVDRFYEPILNYLFRMLRDHAAAEDVCQEVFVRAMQRIGQVRDPKRLKAWLYRIATNAAHDYKRRRASDALYNALPEANLPLDEANLHDSALKERMYVADLLAVLGEEHREVIILRFYEDLSLPAISEVLGIPVGTVKSRLHYALRKLREQIACEDEEVARFAAQRGGQASPSHVG